MSTFPMSTTIGSRKMELEWNDLTVILAICRAGSLSGAARTLGQNHSTVFRKINAIEEKTGVRFFERLPEGYAMTEAGETALRYAERIESEVQALGREVLGQDMRLQGKIHLTAPEGFALTLAPKLMAEFRRMHPEVSIEVSGGSMALDLSRREADVAIRATPKPPDSSLGKKIGDFRFGLYSTLDYIENHADIALQDQDWCLIQGVEDWLVPLIWRKKEQGTRQCVFSSGSAISVINAAAQGLGITMMPCYLGDSEPHLVRVGNPIESLTIELWILTHPDLRHTARVKALMAFLYESLGKQKDLFSGENYKGTCFPWPL